MNPPILLRTARQRRLPLLLLALLIALLVSIPLVHAAIEMATLTAPNPAPSGRYGSTVVALPNGNLVIYDEVSAESIASLHLVDGATLKAISTITMQNLAAKIGQEDIVVLANGNFVVRVESYSPYSRDGIAAAVWGDADTGFLGGGGELSETNALISPMYTVFNEGVVSRLIALANGNYVLWNENWFSDGGDFVGAVTWGNGATGTVGRVSAANSLVGGQAGDVIGGGGVTALANGNYVVISPGWDNGALTNAGAVTWGNGNGGTVGVVSPANSLVGTHENDRAGGGFQNGVYSSQGRIIALTNGNYVVASTNWNNNAAAVTWGNGNGGTVGPISASNSLVGMRRDNTHMLPLTNGNYLITKPYAVVWGNGATGTSGDYDRTKGIYYGSLGVGTEVTATPLANGNYVVSAPQWSSPEARYVGAVTWGNGATGTALMVSAENSLVGSHRDDEFGAVTPLANGNYVVAAHAWDNGDLEDAGIVLWMDGKVQTSGVVTASMGLVGAQTGDLRYVSVVPLVNGNYVVVTHAWDNGSLPNAGAVTWGSGTSGITGVIGPGNSLVGTSAIENVDELPYMGVTPLANGNYVVTHPRWSAGARAEVGAATWGNGATGTVGLISAANSLVGAQSGDRVGAEGAFALADGNYLVRSSTWQNGGSPNAGAITWASGSGTTSGTVSTSNSLTGITQDAQIGNYFENTLTALPDGEYVVESVIPGGSFNWVLTYGKDGGATVSTIPGAYSTATTNNGYNMNWSFNAAYGYLAVGKPDDNRVEILFHRQHALTVTSGGNGAGTISGLFGGLSCGGSCTVQTPANLVVKLTAAPASGSRFGGWGGACSGVTTTVCNVKMDAAKSVTATFLSGAAPTPTLPPMTEWVHLPSVRK